MIAAWTAAWHPALLAHFRRLPLWYAADAAPEADPHRAALIPEMAIPLVPTSWTARIANDPAGPSDVVLVTGNAPRRELAEKLLGKPPTGDTWEADFYALGFAVLQIQAMTRRLRYSSNLDENYLSQRALAAADAACSGDAATVGVALQDCFDLLAQERDHYFTGNPLLVDLTLVPPLNAAQEFSANQLENLRKNLADSDPINLLVAPEQLVALQRQAPELLEQLKARLRDGSADIAGGWSETAGELNQLTALQARDQLQRARDTAANLLGAPTRIFGRLAGGVPHDFLGSLLEQGYRGAIIADFLGGRDSGQSEPKLNWQAGNQKLEAITARPIDAAKSVELMEVASRLGEAMDAGNVPTALLAHWPNQFAETYQDLRVAARWGLAFGKFVTLTQYFEQSARSYHSFKPATPRPAWNWLSDHATKDAAPLQQVREHFAKAVQQETAKVAEQLSQWVMNVPLQSTSPQSTTASSSIWINPYVTAARTVAKLNEWPHAESHSKAVLGSVATSSKEIEVRTEIAGCGFIAFTPGKKPRKGWFKRERKLTDGSTTLRNASMSVEVDASKGSVHGIYTLGVRGNRLSIRLAGFDASDNEQPYSVMQADRVRVRRSDALIGEIEVTGRCLRGKQVDAEFNLVYRLELASHLLHLEGEIDAKFQPHEDPFKRYVALRAAVTDMSVIPQLLVRDRKMPASGRRFLAPLGMHLDLGTQSVTICSGGHAAHRRSEDTVFDTLLATTPGKHAFRLAYGLDVKQPLQEAKSLLAPPCAMQRTSQASASSAGLKGQGYFLHCQPSSLALVHAAIDPQEPRTIELMFVETEGRGRQCRVISCVPLAQAFQVHQPDAPPETLAVEKDTILFEIPSHGIAVVRLTRSATL